MFNLIGKRTYLTLIVIVLHQLAKLGGVDIPNEQISQSVDVVLALMAGIFRYFATQKTDKK